MKKINFNFRLLVLIGVLIMSINQVWAFWYLPSNLGGVERFSVSDNNMHEDNKITFFAVHAGTYKLQLTDGSKWSGNSCIRDLEGSDITKSTDGSDATITITKDKNITVSVVDETNWKVKVSATDPCTYIKYSWGGKTPWTWSNGMNPYGDGRYACTGDYGGTKAFNYQFTGETGDNDIYNDGTNVQLDGDLSTGDNCVFVYDTRTSVYSPALTIKKCSTVDPTCYIYFDNTESNWNDTYTYFMMGRPVAESNPYLATYRMTKLDNTNLYYYVYSGASWDDVDYYAVGGRSSAYDSGNNGWTVVPTNFTDYSAPFTARYNLENTHYYMISKTSAASNTAITIDEKGTAASVLNITSGNLGFKYQVSDNGEDYADLSSGDYTPAEVSMETYSFTNCSTVTANTTQTIEAKSRGTYAKNVTTFAYRGECTLSVSNVQPGYRFDGWYEGNTQKSTSTTYTYYPKANTTVSARFTKLYAYIEGRFQIYNKARDIRTSVGGKGSWVKNSAAIRMDYDDANGQFVLHTYSKPSELNAAFTGSGDGDTDPYFYIKTSTSSSAISSDNEDGPTEYWATTSESSQHVLSSAGTKRAVSKTSTSLTFVGNDRTQTEYVVLYCDGSDAWYQLEYILEYDGNGNTGGSIPAGREYYAAGSTPTTATNSNNLALEGYSFNGWSTSSGVDQVSTISAGSTLAAMSADVKLYTAWSDTKKYYYNGALASGWGTPSNWTRGAVPGTTDDVIALTALEVPIGTPTVNSVRIATSGTYTTASGTEITANGSLTIPAGRMLKVTTDVKNCTISENAPTTGTATTSNRLCIAGSATSGNGALVWGSSSSSPGEALVGFETVSGGIPGSADAINQYIGIPFTSLNSYAYSTSDYSAWMFKVSGGAWVEMHGEDMSPWTGYNIIAHYETEDDWDANPKTNYYLSGTLVSNSNFETTTSSGETLLANSWVAPIMINEITMTHAEKSIYMFNSASKNDTEDDDGTHTAMGNYSGYAINQENVIPSMQSFSTWGAGTITIPYADAVFAGSESSVVNKAPKYDYRENIWAAQDTLDLFVSAESGWADNVRMYIHESFKPEFESGWDVHRMDGMTQAPKLYAATSDGELCVNSVPSADNSVIGFHAGSAANKYTLTFKYSGEDEFILKDTKTGDETPIVDGETYNFTSESSDDDMRFIIKKVPTTVTGVDNISDNASGVQKIMHNGTMYIVRDGRIYDATGSLVK